MPALPDDIVSGVAIANLKSISEQPAMLSNLAYSNIVSTINLSHQNAVSNQQSLNELGVTVLGKAVNRGG
ncbi:MAG: RebB family R body protein [Lentisphaeraceae bacterium]|nr:RebB family R body protein [Lentisphaeraceae bacterium]